MKPTLGIIAGLIVVIGTIPYLRDILKKETKPSRATWTLLTIILLIEVFIQGDLGSGWARVLTLGEVIATASVFLLSIKYGLGGANKIDVGCYILWLITVICWLGLHRPLLAIHLGILADFIAVIPTFLKSWQNPAEESINVFAASSLSGLVAIFAAQEYSYRATVLPLYLFLVNLAVVVTLFFARRSKAR